jgi:outer membrane lipoprotein SlyB
MTLQQNLTRLSAIATAAILALSGCATGGGASSAANYSGGQAMQMQETLEATVVCVRPVTIDSKTGRTVGTVAGGVAGVAVGSRAGQSGSVGSILGATLGGVAGAMAGNMGGGMVGKTDGFAITVRVDKTGKLLTITQEADIQFSQGEHVFLMGTGSNWRVQKRS